MYYSSDYERLAQSQFKEKIGNRRREKITDILLLLISSAVVWLIFPYAFQLLGIDLQQLFPIYIAAALAFIWFSAVNWRSTQVPDGARILRFRSLSFGGHHCVKFFGPGEQLFYSNYDLCLLLPADPFTISLVVKQGLLKDYIIQGTQKKVIEIDLLIMNDLGSALSFADHFSCSILDNSELKDSEYIKRKLMSDREYLVEVVQRKQADDLNNKTNSWLLNLFRDNFYKDEIPGTGIVRSDILKKARSIIGSGLDEFAGMKILQMRIFEYDSITTCLALPEKEADTCGS